MPGLSQRPATVQAEGGWRCVTCGETFLSPSDVRQHWALFDEGHSVFVNIATGRCRHQTIEGFQERDWVLPGQPTAPAKPHWHVGVTK